MICSHGLIGAAAKTDATDRLELPLQMQSGVVREMGPLSFLSPADALERKKRRGALGGGGAEQEQELRRAMFPVFLVAAAAGINSI